jgi:hypothetical protein
VTALCLFVALVAQSDPPAAPLTPAVSVWYRGLPAGTPRQDDLAIIRALGFPAVTWPEAHAAALPELRRQAEVVGLSVIVRPDPGRAASLPANATSINLSVATMAPAAIPAVVWKAIAAGAREVSFDAGEATGAGVSDASGGRRPWVPAALAIARQLTFNGHFFRALRAAAPIVLETPAVRGVDIVLQQDDRSWVLFATNTSPQRATVTARLPAGVPAALWSNMLDGGAMSMLAQSDGARWTVTLQGGEARIYIVNK